MIQFNLHGLLADAALGSLIVAAVPFYAIFLTLGWAWRLWMGMAGQALSLANDTRKAASTG